MVKERVKVDHKDASVNDTNGQGTYKCEECETFYEGEWKNDLENGKGEKTYKDGSVYGMERWRGKWSSLCNKKMVVYMKVNSEYIILFILYLKDCIKYIKESLKMIKRNG